jgi:2-polyprenyl-3-methyl-5-hydroxy-6-metoxy-1,4-benzoquinol methylase
MTQLTYHPAIFDVRNIEQARQIILTSEGGTGTEERWRTETPYIADLIREATDITADSILIDYGCGIGRLAKELIARHGCRVVGVDISASMRALAIEYVQSDRFFACAPEMLGALALRGFVADMALCIWVLQHCLHPGEDVDRIGNALRPGADVFVLNCLHRAVPTKEAAWVHDGIDIRAVLSGRFSVVKEGKPLTGKVADHQSGIFWSHLRKAG